MEKIQSDKHRVFSQSLCRFNTITLKSVIEMKMKANIWIFISCQLVIVHPLSILMTENSSKLIQTYFRSFMNPSVHLYVYKSLYLLSDWQITPSRNFAYKLFRRFLKKNTKREFPEIPKGIESSGIVHFISRIIYKYFWNFYNFFN